MGLLPKRHGGAVRGIATRCLAPCSLLSGASFSRDLQACGGLLLLSSVSHADTASSFCLTRLLKADSEAGKMATTFGGRKECRGLAGSCSLEEAEERCPQGGQLTNTRAWLVVHRESLPRGVKLPFVPAEKQNSRKECLRLPSPPHPLPAPRRHSRRKNSLRACRPCLLVLLPLCTVSGHPRPPAPCLA